MEIQYNESSVIKCYETDKNMSLKPYAFMNIAQEMANIHASMIGFGYDDLIKGDLAWVLSRFKARFFRSPKWREETNRQTWHKGGEGLFFLRDFEVKDREGELLIAATSYWVIINTETRKIQRADHIEGFEGSNAINPKIAPAGEAGKITAPENIMLSSSHKVGLSDLDINGHTNNAKYIEWAMDAIDTSITLNREIDEFQINFNLESRLDDTIELYSAEIDHDRVYVEGKRDGRSIFQSIITFKKSE